MAERASPEKGSPTMAQIAAKNPTSPAAPPTPLERLHHDRARVARELASLNASAANLRRRVEDLWRFGRFDQLDVSLRG